MEIPANPPNVPYPEGLPGWEPPVDPNANREGVHKGIQLYSALVRAAVAGDITEATIDLGLPPASRLARYTLMPRAAIERGLIDVTTPQVLKAVRRASGIIDPPHYPWPGSTRHRPEKPTVYEDEVSPLVGGEVISTSQYISWGDIRDYYKGPLMQSIMPEGVPPHDWGLYHTRDLTELPYAEGKELQPQDRMLLERAFIRLEGIPRLSEGTDMASLAASLPPGTPCLFLIGDRTFTSFRAGIEGLPDAKELKKQETLLMNLILLRSLRTQRPVGYDWLLKTSGYYEHKLTAHLHSLVEEVTANSGVVLRVSNRGNQHNDFANAACIVDARPATFPEEAASATST